MRKHFGLLAAIFICFLLAGALVQNYRAQSETDRRLAALQHQVEQQKSAAAAPARSAAPASPSLVVGNATTLPTEYAEKHQQVLQVMDAGWKLIDERSPEPARHAADLFQAALIKIDPKSPDLYNGLGRSLLIAGKPREAIAAWRRGLELAPTFAEMQSGTGWAYWNLRDPYHAAKAWQAAVAIDPKCVDAWVALAWIDLALGDKAAAKRGFQVLVQRDTKNRAWTTGLAMAQAGNTDVSQIDQFFRLPPLAALQTPVPDPANAVASTAATTPDATPVH